MHSLCTERAPPPCTGCAPAVHSPLTSHRAPSSDPGHAVPGATNLLRVRTAYTCHRGRPPRSLSRSRASTHDGPRRTPERGACRELASRVTSPHRLTSLMRRRRRGRRAHRLSRLTSRQRESHRAQRAVTVQYTHRPARGRDGEEREIIFMAGVELLVLYLYFASTIARPAPMGGGVRV